LFCEDVQPIHVVPAKARTITTGLSFLKELERLSLTNNHLWLMGWTAPYGIDVPE
jgi:hypothetical protein